MDLCEFSFVVPYVFLGIKVTTYDVMSVTMWDDDV